MFLKQVVNFPKTEWWRYAIGILLIALTYMLGQIPMTLAWYYKLGGLDALQNTPPSQLMTALGKNSTLFFALLVFVFTLGGVLLALKIHSQSLLSLVTSRAKVSWSRVFFSFGVVGTFIVFTTLMDYLVNTDDYVWNWNTEAFLLLFIIAVVLLPIQTSVEELVFRGYLMQGFAAISKSRGFAFICSSVLFGAMHFSNPEIQQFGIYAKIFYIGTGLLLAIMTLMDDGMELALGFHAANNLISALLITADYTVIQTDALLKQVSEPAVGITILMPLLIWYPLILILFAKKYKWNNWGLKLFGKL